MRSGFLAALPLLLALAVSGPAFCQSDAGLEDPMAGIAAPGGSHASPAHSHHPRHTRSAHSPTHKAVTRPAAHRTVRAASTRTAKPRVHAKATATHRIPAQSAAASAAAQRAKHLHAVAAQQAIIARENAIRQAAAAKLAAKQKAIAEKQAAAARHAAAVQASAAKALADKQAAAAKIVAARQAIEAKHQAALQAIAAKQAAAHQAALEKIAAAQKAVADKHAAALAAAAAKQAAAQQAAAAKAAAAAAKLAAKNPPPVAAPGAKPLAKPVAALPAKTPEKPDVLNMTRGGSDIPAKAGAQYPVWDIVRWFGALAIVLLGCFYFIKMLKSKGIGVGAPANQADAIKAQSMPLAAAFARPAAKSNGAPKAPVAISPEIAASLTGVAGAGALEVIGSQPLNGSGNVLFLVRAGNRMLLLNSNPNTGIKPVSEWDADDDADFEDSPEPFSSFLSNANTSLRYSRSPDDEAAEAVRTRLAQSATRLAGIGRGQDRD